MRPWVPALAALVLAACQWQPATGHNVALLYGISLYGDINFASNLTYPSLDAQALAPLLRTSSGGVFSTVTTRIDAAATKAQLIADVAAAAATLDADSEFLFYYSGHGTQDGGHAYIAPYGLVTPPSTTPVYGPATLVSENELRDLLATLPTKKVVVILDSCNSGGFLADAASGSVPQDANAYYAALWKAFLSGNAPGAAAELASWYSDQEASTSSALNSWNQALAAGSGFAADQAQVLAAAGALEASFDAQRYGHGAFTHFLLAAKDRGDFDGNGYVTVSEAYRYAFDGLQEEWNGIWGAVGFGTFIQGGNVFLPHLSSGPADYLLFKN